MKTFLSLVCIVSFSCFVAWLLIRIYRVLCFYKNCESYIRNSMNTASIDIAKSELEHAISYLEKNNLTSGRTSIVTSKLHNDIGYFYKNLKKQYDFLDHKCKNSLTEVNIQNILKEYEDNLHSRTANGVKTLIPEGISIYPSNTVFCIWGTMSFITLVISFILKFFN